MADVSDERSLAMWLADQPDDALDALLRRREISPGAAWRDFFDAAEALLDPPSIERALTALPRTALTALVDAAAPNTPTADRARAALAGAALVRADGTVPRPVADTVAAVAQRHPDAFRSVPDAGVPATADHDEAAAAAERAFTTAGSLADLLVAMQHRPLTRTGGGTVTAADRKPLVDAGAVTDAEHLEDLLLVAASAGLARPDDRQWAVTAAGLAWLAASTPQRWEQAAGGIVAALPEALRTDTGGHVPISAWWHAFPLDPSWPAEAARLERVVRAWGLLTESDAETAWATRLRDDATADAEALAAMLPPEIDRIYLQADLTAIAPGPLAPALDMRLRAIAVRESHAQASTYRFTAESLSAGLVAGHTAAGILDFLSELSLSGIPQPLAYLVETTAARHGLVQVSAGDVGTIVTSTDASVIATVEVDQTLRPLGLQRDGQRLVSRAERDVVYWALADARYPVVALGPDGTPEPLQRSRIADDAAPAPASPYAALIERLRAGSGEAGDSAWRERELDKAVRARAEIVVVVRLPDGSTREFTLEATGLGGGRLRGRDRGADIERTLPVSSIVSVRPA